ncbi:MAG: hypothetical protein Q9219_002660 [cf. Caloplaca sp. 3 TL-2023]
MPAPNSPSNTHPSSSNSTRPTTSPEPRDLEPQPPNTTTTSTDDVTHGAFSPSNLFQGLSHLLHSVLVLGALDARARFLSRNTSSSDLDLSTENDDLPRTDEHTTSSTIFEPAQTFGPGISSSSSPSSDDIASPAINPAAVDSQPHQQTPSPLFGSFSPPSFATILHQASEAEPIDFCDWEPEFFASPDDIRSPTTLSCSPPGTRSWLSIFTALFFRRRNGRDGMLSEEEEEEEERPRIRSVKAERTVEVVNGRAAERRGSWSGVVVQAGAGEVELDADADEGNSEEEEEESEDEDDLAPFNRLEKRRGRE